MNFIKVSNYEEMSDKAAEIIISELKRKKNYVLGLATGSTPIGTYKTLKLKPCAWPGSWYGSWPIITTFTSSSLQQEKQLKRFFFSGYTTFESYSWSKKSNKSKKYCFLYKKSNKLFQLLTEIPIKISFCSRMLKQIKQQKTLY